MREFFRIIFYFSQKRASFLFKKSEIAIDSVIISGILPPKSNKLSGLFLL